MPHESHRLCHGYMQPLSDSEAHSGGILGVVSQSSMAGGWGSRLILLLTPGLQGVGKLPGVYVMYRENKQC